MKSVVSLLTKPPRPSATYSSSSPYFLCFIAYIISPPPLFPLSFTFSSSLPLSSPSSLPISPFLFPSLSFFSLFSPSPLFPSSLHSFLYPSSALPLPFPLLLRMYVYVRVSIRVCMHAPAHVCTCRTRFTCALCLSHAATRHKQARKICRAHTRPSAASTPTPRTGRGLI